MVYEIDGFSATLEQSEIINAVIRGDSIKVMALAGTGKTSTARMIAHYYVVKTTYICFNKVIANKAQKEMPNHVDSRTLNSIAFRAIMPHSNTDRLVPNLYVSDVKSVLGVSSDSAAKLIRDMLTEFCISDSNDIEEFFKSHEGELVSHLVKKYWEKAWEKGSEVKITHDFYVKEFQLKNKQIKSALLLIDESQDMNPVAVKIIKQQKNAQMVWIGDSNQQIYSWRGSIDQLEKLDLPAYGLTASFRFGQDLADLANIALEAVNSEYFLKGLGSKTIVHFDKTLKFMKGKTFLGRTNMYLFNLALSQSRRGARIYLPSYKDSKKALWSAFFLKIGKPEKISYLPFKRYRNWVEFCDHADLEKEIELIIKFLDAYKDIKRVLTEVEERSVDNPEDADIRFYTVHKAKGEEWDDVVVSDEFTEIEYTDEHANIKKEDVNLLYVAITRAKKNLWISSEAISQLPTS